MKITLCGSTRFVKAFADWNAGLTLAGHVVYGLAMHGRQTSDKGKPEELELITDDEKIVLDLMHLAKIEESDAVVILNVDDYTGESTKRELRWAQLRGKQVFYLENARRGVGVIGASVWHIYSTDDKPLLSSAGRKYFKAYGE